MMHVLCELYNNAVMQRDMSSRCVLLRVFRQCAGRSQPRHWFWIGCRCSQVELSLRLRRFLSVHDSERETFCSALVRACFGHQKQCFDDYWRKEERSCKMMSNRVSWKLGWVWSIDCMLVSFCKVKWSPSNPLRILVGLNTFFKGPSVQPNQAAL